MSYVSNVVLTARYINRAAKEAILAVRQPERPVGFRLVNEHAGGGKVWEADTFMAAVNHLDTEALIAALEPLLVHAGGVVLVIHHEGDDEEDVWAWHYTSGRFVLVLPESERAPVSKESTE